MAGKKSRNLTKVTEIQLVNFYAKFSMKLEMVPVAQKPRPVAYYL